MLQLCAQICYWQKLLQLDSACAVVCRFVAYLDEATPTEAEIIVWSQHHIADSDEVCLFSILSAWLLTGACPTVRGKPVHDE